MIEHHGPGQHQNHPTHAHAQQARITEVEIDPGYQNAS